MSSLNVGEMEALNVEPQLPGTHLYADVVYYAHFTGACSELGSGGFTRLVHILI